MKPPEDDADSRRLARLKPALPETAAPRAGPAGAPLSREPLRHGGRPPSVIGTAARTEAPGIARRTVADPPAPVAPAAKPATRRLLGFVDGLSAEGAITGWAYYTADPQLRVRVGVLDGEDIVVAGIANLQRVEGRDVPGHGDGRCGFVLPLPRRLFDGRRHALLVRCELPDAEPADVAPFTVELETDLSEAALARADDPTRLAPLPFVPPARSAEPRPETYVPGHYVICRAGFPRPVYHTRGWHDPEAEFTWIDGIEGTIEMAIRRPAHAYVLTIEVTPNGVGDRPQTLQVFVNYLCVGLFEVPSPRTLAIPLPGELFFLRTTRINLHCREAVVGSDFGVPDARRLGVAVRSWCIA